MSVIGNYVTGSKVRKKGSDKFTIDCFNTTGDVIVNSIKHWFCIFVVVIILEIFNLKLFYDFFSFTLEKNLGSQSHIFMFKKP